jgi:hypothetical protein
LQKSLTTFTTFKKSCKTGRSKTLTRTKKFKNEPFFRVKTKITGKIWKILVFLIPAAVPVSLPGSLWGRCCPSAGRSWVAWYVYTWKQKRPVNGR